MNFYHGKLEYCRTDDGPLPLSMRRVPAGRHPEKLFHDHDFSEFVLVESGQAEHIAGEKRCPVRTGDVLLLHPGIIHAYDRTRDFQIVNIIYDSRKLAPPLLDCWQLPLFQQFYPGNKVPAPDTLLKPILHLEKEDLRRVQDCIAALETELGGRRPGREFGAFTRFLEFTLLLARCGEEKNRNSHIREGVNRAIAFLNSHYAEKITIEELLHLAHMSRRNFFRCFRITAGCAPMEYLIRKRLHIAAGELPLPGKNIGEIALESGFPDSNFFSKQFRKEFHCSPTEFRKRHLRKKVITAIL